MYFVSEKVLLFFTDGGQTDPNNKHEVLRKIENLKDVTVLTYGLGDGMIVY